MPGRITQRPSPTTDAQWARSIDQRLAALEAGGTSVRIGRWVITVDSSGELTASTLGRSVPLTMPSAAIIAAIDGAIAAAQPIEGSV